MLDVSTLASLAAKTSVLLIIVALACGLLAHKSAAYRHCLWSAALALALLLPLAMACVPSWEVVPAFWSSHAALSAVASTPHPSAGRAMTETGVVMLWSTGVLLFLLRDLLASIGLARWTRRAEPLSSARWRATLRGTSSALGRGAQLRILESAHITSPCTWGVARPVLLLPRAGGEWLEWQRRDALLHELAHVERLDYLTAFVARLACAVHWYNPLVWWAAAQAKRLQEEACDDVVLRAGGKPSEYAQFLLDIARDRQRECGRLRLAIGMLRRSALRSRVLAILDPHRTRGQPDRRSVLVALVPLCGVTIVLAAAARVPPVQVDDPVSVVTAMPVGSDDFSPMKEVAARVFKAQLTARPAPMLAATEPAQARAPSEPPRKSRQPLEPLPALESLPAVRAVPAIPAIPATRAIPATPATPAIPATPATPATPAGVRFAPRPLEDSGTEDRVEFQTRTAP